MNTKRKVCLMTLLVSGLLLTACGNSATNQGQNTTENNIEHKVEATIDNSTLTKSQESMAEPTMPPEVTPEPTEKTSRETVTIDPTKPLVALTFDDGPNQSTTVEVLDLLEEYDITASFFLIGNNINMNTMNVVKRAYDMGCEINNHSKSHNAMNSMTADEIAEEIDTVNTMITNITGEAPKFFRPPYISVSDTMYNTIDMPFICGVGCNDWDASVTAEERAEKTLEHVKDGTIILLHDSYGNTPTVEALKTIIPTLLEDGYQFVTVSQLFEAKGIEIDAEDTNLYSVVE